MERTSSVSTKAALSLFAAIVAWNVFRAATFPVTVGEAWNYDRFIGPGWKESLAHFDLNNHVLNTILVKISTWRMHLTELDLRLPSLLGGVLYLWAAFRLARRFGEGAMFVTVAVLLALNPVVLDAMSEARGYGMGLAFLLWAIELLMRDRTNLAAVCLGLSVASALAFGAPAVATVAVYLAFFRKDRLNFVLLALISAFVFVAVPVDHPYARAFLEGATSLRQTINGITQLSVGISSAALLTGARVAVGILAAVGAAAAVRSRRSLEGIVGGTLAITLVVLLAAHRWLHAPFPEGGAVYLIALCTLLVSAIVFKWNRKAANIAFQVGAIGLAVVYVSNTGWTSYRGAEEFEGGRNLAKTLRAEVGRRSVRIAVSPSAEPIINYYRTRLRQGNWQRIERKPVERSADYFVLAGPDRSLVGPWGLHVLYKDAGLVLAR